MEGIILPYPTPPMTPIPPALLTAAASLGPAATFIPANMTGWLIFRRSVTVVRICSSLELAHTGSGGKTMANDDLRGDAMAMEEE